MPLQDRLHWSQSPLYLIDGSSFLYRAFYAFPDLSRSDGFPTNALFITMRILLKILNQERPSHICFILDGKGPSFRQEIMPAYKAQRQKMPETLNVQIQPLLQGVQLLGLPLHVTEQAEADDVIASLCAKFKARIPVVIVGSDKDLRQCLDASVVLWDPGQRTEKLVTLEDFQTTEGFTPGQWPDFQALVGDKSDNIPGVPGVGPKTARNLLARFPTLEDLQQGFDHLRAKEQEKLGPHMQALFQYRELTRLRTDQAEDITLEQLQAQPPDTNQLAQFFTSYEFKSLLSDLGPRTDKEPAAQEAKADQEPIAPTQVEQVPDLGGQAVGLVGTVDGVLLGWQEQEALVQAPVPDMVRAVQTCSVLYVPSVKDLYETDPAWDDLPLDRVFDLSLAAYLLNPEEREYSWKKIKQIYWPEIDVHADNQGLAALHIGHIVQQRVDQAGLMQLMQEIETPLIPVLVRMQRRGIGIDLEAFTTFLQEVEADLERLTESAYVRAGTEFNLRSPQQLADILFHRLGLRPGRKTPGGQPSTSITVLEGLQHQHPIIREIVQYRSLEKLRSTYLAPLPKLMDDKGRIHTTFNHLATATGRLSSSQPNLQNIPIRGEFGPRMRSCFVAAENNRLVAADYSQIELRILAHMSQESHLLDAFAANDDIHTRTASLLLDTPQEQITADDRRKAKTINFGLIYGMGPQKLSRDLGISLNEAKEFIEKYFSRLPQVRAFFQEVEARAKTNGSVTTMAGRRRLLPDINSRNEHLAGQARRMAINTVVQGSAADIIKMAMIGVEHDPELKRLQARLILQVHDELLLEAPAAEAERSGERVAEIMTSVRDLSVPLLVDWGTGRSWAEAH